MAHPRARRRLLTLAALGSAVATVVALRRRSIARHAEEFNRRYS
jgi:hypothetical protein